MFKCHILFYSFPKAIASRLEEMLNKDEENIPQVIATMADESKQTELLADDEEEDFLDEGNYKTFNSIQFNSLYHLHNYNR